VVDEQEYDADEEHPWLDVPDDISGALTEPWTPSSAPFIEQGGRTLPAFMIESAVIATPQYSMALRRQRRALAIYAVTAVLALLGMCGMFFVLGGRFAPNGTPHLTLFPSRASVGGQTGATPTATPAPTSTATPPPVQPYAPPATPTPTPTDTPSPVVGIRPIHPRPLPSPTPPPASIATPAPVATSTPVPTTPVPSQISPTLLVTRDPTPPPHLRIERGGDAGAMNCARTMP
jgi:hypothetical protein